MGLAQTGTGKTAAFALPILQRLTQGKLRQIRALIIAPTRELAEQIHQTFIDLGKHTRVRSVAIYGGVGKGKQLDALRRGVEVVVACPGRLLDLAGEGHLDFSNVEVLVLDEADRMCDMGFLPDIKRILKLMPSQRQTLFFSATMPEDIRQLSRQILKDPQTVQIGIIAPAKTVSHALFPVTQKMKKNLLTGDVRPNSNRSGVDLYAHQDGAPVSWPAILKRKGIASPRCRAICRRTSGSRRSMVFVMANMTSSWLRTSPRAVST